MEAASNDSRTALMLSAGAGHDGCLRQLIAAKADVKVANKNGWTLKFAEHLKHSKCVELLQKAAAAKP